MANRRGCCLLACRRWSAYGNLRLVAPGHGPVSERAAADASGVVAIAAFTGENDVTVGVAVHKDAGIALFVGPELLPRTEVRWLRRSSCGNRWRCTSGRAQEVRHEGPLRRVPWRQRRPRLQLRSRRRSRVARTWTASAFPGKFVVVAAADGITGMPSMRQLTGIAIPVVAGVAVEALHGVGDDHVEEGLEGIGEALQKGSLLVNGSSANGWPCAARHTASHAALRCGRWMAAAGSGLRVGNQCSRSCQPKWLRDLIGGNDLFAKASMVRASPGVKNRHGPAWRRRRSAREESSGGGCDLQEAARRVRALRLATDWNLR